ncbi:MAG TPA: SRPBCC family protein [Thermoplasmata archaeon]|nr:SRPBCC family protein [Thermoplasmata archaeon]
MPAIKRRASVTSRVDDAFEYVAEWRNFSNYIPMFVDIEATSLVQYGPGTSLDLTMLLGNKVQMKTTLDIVDFLKNERVVFKSSQGIRTKTTWGFKDIGGKVLITLDFEFEMPATMNIREDEKLALSRSIEDAWGKSLDMLKWILESKPPSAD